MMFKNKTALSNTTIHILETNQLEEELHYDYIEELAAARWHHLNHEESEILKSKTRVGYNLSPKNLTKPPQNSLERKISRSPLLTILEDAFREYESTDQNLINNEEDGQNLLSSNKVFESSREKFQGLESNINIEEGPQSSKKKLVESSSKPFSPIKSPPVDTRPYALNVIDLLESYKIIESNIVNKPQGYIERSISKEIRGESTHCHNRATSNSSRMRINP
jgi:hypothetical protein